MTSDPRDGTRRIGRGMLAVFWLLVLGLGWWFFEDLIADQHDPNRNLVVAPGSGELVLQRNRSGHYVAPGEINGRPVRFLLDTGATQVSVPAHLGEALGLRPGAPMQVITANGTVTVRATRVESLRLGPFLLRDVGAHLNPGMRDDQVLLGMSVLKQLEFTQRGDTLTLRPHAD